MPGEILRVNAKLDIIGHRKPMPIAKSSLKEEAAQKTLFYRGFGPLAVAMILAFALAALCPADTNLSLNMLHRQDRWLLFGGSLLLFLGLWHVPAQRRPLTANWRIAAVAAACMGLAAFAGHYWILSGYDLSRDEQLATFDAAIFARGMVVAPLPEAWRLHADALNTIYLYPTRETAAWVSAYLPLNAALRALFALAGNAALTGPAMILLGALALWGCARRIWPENGEAPVVALLLYLGSGQILFNGMTAYAMPAHLALNLCWLWLFLRRTMGSDLAAVLLGFVAVGLHQPIMHPMFAAPILASLVLERDWRRAAFYVVAYAAIGAFWFWWPGFIWTLVEADPLAPQADGVDFWTRLLLAIKDGGALRFPNMGANIIRFLAWQHLLLLPLLLLGLRFAWRDRLAGGLAAGILLTLAVMTIILPYQGHGFGYRYLHGLIGNAILLAVYGWVALKEHLDSWRPLLVRTTLASILFVFPVQAWIAHGFYAPFARISAQIDASDADFVVIGKSDASYSADLVTNPPFLDRRPIRLLRENIDEPLAGTLCARGAAVALGDQTLLAPINAYYGKIRGVNHKATGALATRLEELGCRVEIIG